jgi:hypothetical protein
MNRFLKTIAVFIGLFAAESAPIHKRQLQLLGSINNNHGCVSDGGYQWCEHTQTCERPWITPCVDNCHSSPCLNGGTCQVLFNSYTCLCDSSYTGQNCETSINNDITATTGQRCANGFCENPRDCPLCHSGLTCQIPRNSICAGTCYGVCVHEHDTTISNPIQIDPMPPIRPPIRNNIHLQIPHGCTQWYDGCNNCMVSNGAIIGCTRMMCITQNTPECRSYGH